MSMEQQAYNEWKWQARLRYLAVLKVLTILEFMGAILAVATAHTIGITREGFICVGGFVLMRLLTAHINQRHVATAIDAQDKYMLYPFF